MDIWKILKKEKVWHHRLYRSIWSQHAWRGFYRGRIRLTAPVPRSDLQGTSHHSKLVRRVCLVSNMYKFYLPSLPFFWIKRRACVFNLLLQAKHYPSLFKCKCYLSTRWDFLRLVTRLKKKSNRTCIIHSKQALSRQYWYSLNSLFF